MRADFRRKIQACSNLKIKLWQILPLCYEEQIAFKILHSCRWELSLGGWGHGEGITRQVGRRAWGEGEGENWEGMIFLPQHSLVNEQALPTFYKRQLFSSLVAVTTWSNVGPF